MTTKVTQDYGIRPDVDKDPADDSYQEFAQRPTWSRGMDVELQKHSELMRPWEHDDFPEMEHYYPTPLGGWPDTILENRTMELRPQGEVADKKWPFPDCPCCFGGIERECEAGVPTSMYWDPPVWNYPFNPATQFWTIEGDYLEGSVKIFLPGYYTEYLAKGKDIPWYYASGYAAQFFWHTINWEWDPNAPGVAIDGWAHVTLSYTILGLCKETRDIYVLCDCCKSEAYVAMTLDTANTDDTIDSSTPATVTVKDGCGPYTWSVSGTGYSISPSGKSSSLSAVVSVVGGTCGVDYAAYCTVTITDSCGTTKTKRIRNTGGGWVLVSSDLCILPWTTSASCWYTSTPDFDCELIEDEKRQTQSVKWVSSNSGKTCAEVSCPCTGFECTYCLDYTTYWEWPGYQVPCIDQPPNSVCNKSISLLYYEWGCP